MSDADVGASADEVVDARQLQFVAPRDVRVRRTAVGGVDADEVRVESTLSAISPGTELLFYRDQVPTDVPVDETIEALDGDFSYPLSYGYAVVGVVTAAGADVDDAWVGRRVFAFHPHAGQFCTSPEALVALPDGVADETAAFLATVETGVGLVMDARPRIGDRVAVFGQGVVGLVTTALLSRFPLGELVTVDALATRRERSLAMGADRSLTPDDVGAGAFDEGDRVDLAIEVSGNPAALDDAIDATGDGGRVLVGSWYGRKPTSVDLGGRFHRSHIRIQSSQVSRIDASHAARWDKDRRMAVVLDHLSELELSTLVTHRLPVDDAPEAYRLLDETPAEALQVLLTY